MVDNRKNLLDSCVTCFCARYEGALGDCERVVTTEMVNNPDYQPKIEDVETLLKKERAKRQSYEGKLSPS